MLMLLLVVVVLLLLLTRVLISFAHHSSSCGRTVSQMAGPNTGKAQQRAKSNLSSPVHSTKRPRRLPSSKSTGPKNPQSTQKSMQLTWTSIDERKSGCMLSHAALAAAGLALLISLQDHS